MALIKKSMKVDYFFRELENVDVTSAIQSKELSQYLKGRVKEDWEEDYKYFCKESYDRNLAWEYLCSCRFDYSHSDGDMCIIKEVRDYAIFSKWILKFHKAMEIAAENYNIEDWLDENGFYSKDSTVNYNRSGDYDDFPF